MARRDSRRRIALALAGVALVWCVRARADDERAAKQLFSRGVERLLSSDYATAAAAFRQSYELRPRPAALCNLALTYNRWGGHEVEAADAYRRCADSDASGRLRDYALARIEALRTAVPPPAPREPAAAPPSIPAGGATAPDASPPPSTASASPAPSVPPPQSGSPPPPAATTRSGPPAPPAVTTRSSPPARLAATPAAGDENRRAPRRLYKAWWLWTAAAALAAGTGVVLGVELGARHSPATSLGSFGPNAMSLRFP